MSKILNLILNRSAKLIGASVAKQMNKQLRIYSNLMQLHLGLLLVAMVVLVSLTLGDASKVLVLVVVVVVVVVVPLAQSTNSG